MKDKVKCAICPRKVKEYGKKFCSVECLYLNNFLIGMRGKSKVRKRVEELIKDEILEIKIKTKNKTYNLKCAN